MSSARLRGLHGPRGPRSCHRAHRRARVPRRQGPRRLRGDAPGPTEQIRRRLRVPPRRRRPGPRARPTRDVSVKTNTDNLIIDPVVGAKRFSNYFWAGVVSIGATGFLIAGASSCFEHNLLFFIDAASEIKFFPQGLVMSFYGVAGSLLATYLWLTINWDVGAGTTSSTRTRASSPSSATASPARTGASTS